MIEDAPALRMSPPGFFADPALAAVLDALPEARVVGGAVRDALLGRAVADVDLAIPRRPEDVIAALRQVGLNAVPTGIAHGTVTALSGERAFEVTSLRRDLITDGRHAVVAFIADWRADAARRDFTLNALSMTRDGAVFDYWGGLPDLHAGSIRFVGDPAARIAEDALRILRFFRFFACYARLPPDTATRAALHAGAPGLARLAPERVWKELTGLLAAPDPLPAVALMAQLGILAAVLPKGVAQERLARLIAAGAPADPLLRLAALVDSDLTALAKRLRLSAAERTRLLALRGGPTPALEADDDVLRRMLTELDPRLDVTVLQGRLWLADDGDPRWGEVRARLAALPRPEFSLAGRDALSLGVPPGPQVGVLLGAVRGWWLAGGCTADRAASLGRLAEVVAEQGQRATVPLVLPLVRKPRKDSRG
ncbi:MAG: CCA tRNA nucleotidyltransferase [Acetobacteraceae bacterium]